MGGYFKVWRKIEDSKSWSRGALYRGLMITLLQKANWKQGYFHGQEILPGQLACSGASLASELDLSRYQVMRMLATLEDDGFISRQTFGKVCTLITVVNWQLYQSATEEAAQQPHNGRTSGAQVPHTIEEGKKARKEIPPASADAAEERASLSGKEKQEGAGARTGSAHDRRREESKKRNPSCIRRCSGGAGFPFGEGKAGRRRGAHRFRTRYEQRPQICRIRYRGRART